MRNLSDDDDELPADSSDNADTDSVTPRRALITAALEAVDTGAVRTALNATIPAIIIITAPSGSWARALSYEIRRDHPDASPIVVVERKKDGNEWVVGALLEKIATGDHVVICSPDPAGLLPPLVHAAADLDLIVPAASSAP